MTRLRRTSPETLDDEQNSKSNERHTESNQPWPQKPSQQGRKFSPIKVDSRAITKYTPAVQPQQACLDVAHRQNADSERDELKSEPGANHNIASILRGLRIPHLTGVSAPCSPRDPAHNLAVQFG